LHTKVRQIKLTAIKNNYKYHPEALSVVGFEGTKGQK